jgi:hypothetical protein
MTPASITIAAIFTAGFAASVAAAPREPRPATPASAVSSSSLPSCSADGKKGRQFIGGNAFRGGLASSVYGQVFFASRGASRTGSSEASNSSGGRISGGFPGNGNANGHEDPGANGPGRGANGSDGAPGKGLGKALVKDAGVGAVVNPEPGTLLLIGAGLGAMAFRRRRQARKNQGL